MRRALFTIVASMSLLLCVATVALWVRSYVVSDHFSWTYPTGSSGLRIAHGRCWRYWGTNEKWPGSSLDSFRASFRYRTQRPPVPWPGRNWMWSGFYWDGFYNWIDVVEPQRRRGNRELAVPFWPFALATALLPARWLVLSHRWRRAARRARGGLCVACGYDLTGNTSGACPECGRPAGPACSPTRTRPPAPPTTRRAST